MLFVDIVGKYFDEISQDSGRYCFGVQETLKALEMGAVEILIVWENLEVIRYVLKNNTTTGTCRYLEWFTRKALIQSTWYTGSFDSTVLYGLLPTPSRRLLLVGVVEFVCVC